VADFSVDVALTEFQRATAAEHLERTWHLCYGSAERARSNYFRERPVDPCPDPRCPTNSPPALVLRELAGAFRGKGHVRVKLTGMDKFAAARMSQLLEQTAYRAQGGDDAEVASALTRLARSFDAHCRVPGGPLERAEYARYPAAVRERESSAREAARLRVRDKSRPKEWLDDFEAVQGA
jgi:hypothetical protein